MKAVVQFLFKLGSPSWFYKFSGPFVPVLGLISFALIVYGVIDGLLYAPVHSQQGNSYRIIYIHVPTSFVALSCYYLMAIMGAIFLIWRTKMAEVVLSCSALIGAVMAFLSLVTGAIWGKPTWGAWWVWDARVTSMLVLFFLYLGVLALSNAFERDEQGISAASILALVGTVNIPIIYWSVDWWLGLHQGATLRLTEESSIDPSMKVPLLTLIGGIYLFYLFLLLLHSRAEILKREQRKNWVQELVK